jgi:uncharacterized protein involved in exopolysaccharide biosynthesis
MIKSRYKKNKKNIDFEKINLVDLITPYLSKWYYFVITSILIFAIIFLYLKYQIPVYKNTTSILISEDQGQSNQQGFSLLEDLDLIQSSSNLSNEVEKLKANTVLEPVVDSINLQVISFLIGDKSGIRRTELFENSPIYIELVDSLVNPKFKTNSFEIIFISEESINLISSFEK